MKASRQLVEISNTVVTAVALTALCTSLTRDGAAQQPGQPRLLVEYVDPALLQTNVAPRAPNSKQTAATTPSRESSVRWQFVAVPLAGRKTTSDRLQKFETDFGSDRHEPTLVLGSIQATKYQLDKTTFALQEFTKSLEFDYQLRDMWMENPTNSPPRRSYSDPISDALEHSRLRTVVNMTDPNTGGAFVGMKLQVPFGD